MNTTTSNNLKDELTHSLELSNSHFSSAADYRAWARGVLACYDIDQPKLISVLAGAARAYTLNTRRIDSATNKISAAIEIAAGALDTAIGGRE